MSMKALTALQLLEIFGTYAAMTLLLPALLFYKKISGMRFSVRFMIYQSAGNFYIITLVLILQLLHISNWFTLTGFTAVIFFVIYLRMYHKNLKESLQKLSEDIKKLAEGKYGGRLFLRRLLVRVRRLLKKLIVTAGRRCWRNLPDVLLILAVFAVYAVNYGVNAFEHYSYGMSDIVVHNYWINYMSRGKMFVAGVYPYGFHCVIYFLHTVFMIDTYVLLRLFWVVQSLVIHLMLLAFLRVCCKARYTAYAGLGIYLVMNLFRDNTYIRYFSSLPQEFGMIFILPSIAFLFLFFEQKQKEIHHKEPAELQAWGTGSEAAGSEDEAVLVLEEDARDGSFRIRRIALENTQVQALRQEYAAESFWYLAFFSISFSLTLTVHFYNTMVAGLFCLGIAAGYCFRLFCRPYFGRIMLAGIAAIVMSVLPMLLAFIGGTPLEGSMRWAMSIIKGTQEQTAATEKEEQEDEEEEFELTDLPHSVFLKDSMIISEGRIVSRKGSIDGGSVVSKGDVVVNSHIIEGGQIVSGGRLLDDGEVFYEGEFIAVGYHLPEDGSVPVQVPENPAPPTALERIRNKIASAVYNTIKICLFNLEYEWMVWMVPASMILSFLLSVVFFLLRQTEYAARVLSVTVYMGILTIVFTAPNLGLPELMEAVGRTSVYYAYSLTVLWCLCIDSILYLLFGLFWRGRAANLLSFVLVPVFVFVIWSNGMLKRMTYPEGMQMNDAVLCLTNIIRDNQDLTWTIVSANDELRMGEDHGFHYELDLFLREMEHRGGRSTIYIPTKKVYFFIEKIPVSYSRDYENSGQAVSEKGAASKLPAAQGIEMYKGEQRFIEMSRMYYWAEEFARMYPREFKVYYESEEFVCYCVDQNEYSLFNFSIDYDYNMRTYAEE